MHSPPPSDSDAAVSDAREPDDPTAATTRRSLVAALASVGISLPLAGCGLPGTSSPETDYRTAGSTASPSSGTDANLGPAPTLVGPWPQARADAANTGAAESTAPTSDPSVRWETTAAGTVGAAVGVPGPSGPTASFETGDGDDSEAAVYAVAEDGRVAAVDGDGTVRWRTTVEAGRFPPSAADGRVVVPARERLTVLDADTGELRRTIDVPGGILYAPTLDGGRAFVGTFSGGVVAVDLASGEQLWQAGEPSRAFPPVVVDGVAYVAARRWDADDGGGSGDAGVLVAVDVESGTVRWTEPLEGHPTAPPGVHDGVVFAGTHRGAVHAVEAGSGRERWRETVGDWVTRGPTAAADGVYVVVLGEGPAKLTPDGSVAWRTGEGDGPGLEVGTNPVLTDEAALFGGTEGLVAVGRDDGAVRWRAPTDGAVQFDVRVEDGTAYAGDRYGTVVAVDAASGEQRWTLPFQPETVPGPVVGPRTVAGGSRDGGTYDLLAVDGLELGVVGSIGGTGLTPAFLDGADGSRETLLAGGTDGSFARVRTIDYGDAPGADLPPTATPTAIPGPGEPTITPTPHIDFPEPESLWESTPEVEPRSPITYADGWGYVGTSEGVAAVDARTGSLRLRRGLGSPVPGAPAVVDDRLFAATRAGRLVALEVVTDGRSGSTADTDVAWEVSLDGDVRSGPAVADGSVYVADESGTVTAVGVDGDRRWSQSLDGAIYGGVAVAGGHVFVGTTAGEVVALAREGGSVAWRAPAEGAIHASPAVATEADGTGGTGEAGTATVYAGDHAGTLSAFDAAKGDVRWRLSLGRWADAPPALGHGAVFLADGTGRVYAVVGE
ncbi:outer membrane protein assembly factor BamB family protein [Halobellus rubicundus]|uniref:PQQ-binding-like beta-propeller repeat protein n=1 Tax=Halobellus rubicundus TaxID=2996466 RepID=A0ABD5MFA6_9EURY